MVNIELTLISIIQGVAFSFLAEHSRDVIIGLQLVFWPYAVTGLMIILLFWSRYVDPHPHCNSLAIGARP